MIYNWNLMELVNNFYWHPKSILFVFIFVCSAFLHELVFRLTEILFFLDTALWSTILMLVHTWSCLQAIFHIFVSLNIHTKLNICIQSIFSVFFFSLSRCYIDMIMIEFVIPFKFSHIFWYFIPKRCSNDTSLID